MENKLVVIQAIIEVFNWNHLSASMSLISLKRKGKPCICKPILLTKGPHTSVLI